MQANLSVEEGDVSLFDGIYEQHRRPVFAYLRGKCGEADTAADLLQETFLRAWRHLDDVRRVPIERRLYWLLAVAGNVSNDYYRRRMVREPLAHPLPETLPSGRRSHDPAAAAEAASMTNALDRALERLPEDLRVVICMRYLGEMNSSEIGETLERPAGTVRYQLGRARVLLARELGIIGREVAAQTGSLDE